jgi:hypothetical protein
MKYVQPFGISDPNAPYINGDPSTGTAGSIPPAASIEYPQREIVNLIADAGRASPDNSDLHQLARAVQSNLLVSTDDGGTANQYQVTLIPAPGSYYKYMQIICKIANANSGPTRLNVNAMGPKPVLHVDGAELSAGELKANSITCFEYDGTNFQLAWSTGGYGGGPGLIYLTGNLDWYVDSAIGDDALYDGTSATLVAGTLHGPYKTIQKAWDQIPRYNNNGFQQAIHVAHGSYTGFRARSINGVGSVLLVGDPAAPGTCTIDGTGKSAAAYVNTLGLYFIRGFSLGCTGTGSSTDPIGNIWVQGAGQQVYVGEMTFRWSAGGHILSAFGAIVYSWGAGCLWTISGGATGGFVAPWHGNCFMACTGGLLTNFGAGGPNITINVASSFAGAFAYSIMFGQVQITTYTALVGAGNVTGTRFYVAQNALIVTGGGVNYYPGTVAGTAVTANGGYYI